MLISLILTDMYSVVCLLKPVSVSVPLYEAVDGKDDISELQVNVYKFPSVCMHFSQSVTRSNCYSYTLLFNYSYLHFVIIQCHACR